MITSRLLFLFLGMVCVAGNCFQLLARQWCKVEAHLGHSWPLVLVFGADKSTELMKTLIFEVFV